MEEVIILMILFPMLSSPIFTPFAKQKGDGESVRASSFLKVQRKAEAIRRRNNEREKEKEKDFNMKTGK